MKSRLILHFLFAALLYISHTLQAYAGLVNCSEPVRWEASAEWLYFLSAIDQSDYVAIDEGGTVAGVRGPLKTMDQDWHSGYRLESAYYPNPCDAIRVRWTQFHNAIDETSCTEEGFKIPTLAYVAQAQILSENSTAFARNTYNYHYLDLLYELTFYSRPCFSLELAGGIQYSSLGIKQHYFYTSAGGTQLFGSYSSHLRGIGPELGLSFTYDIYRRLSLRGSALGTFLISKKTAQVDLNGTVATNGIYDEKKYYVSNFVTNARLGLAYNCRCGFFSNHIGLAAEIGYELLNFYKGFQRILFYDSSRRGHTVNLYQDFTLHGPYVRLDLHY